MRLQPWESSQAYFNYNSPLDANKLLNYQQSATTWSAYAYGFSHRLDHLNLWRNCHFWCDGLLFCFMRRGVGLV